MGGSTSTPLELESPEAIQINKKISEHDRDLLNQVQKVWSETNPASPAEYMIENYGKMINMLKGIQELGESKIVKWKAKLLARRADYYRLQGKKEEASKDLQDAYKIDPKCSEIYFFKARLYDSQGKEEEALVELQNYLKHAPESERYYGYREMAWIAFSIHNYEEAMANIQKMLQARQNDFDALRTQAAIYIVQGEYAAAIAELTSLLQCNPSNVNLYLNRSYCYLQTKEYQLAWEDLDEALKQADSWDHWEKEYRLIMVRIYRAMVFVRLEKLDLLQNELQECTKAKGFEHDHIQNTILLEMANAAQALRRCAKRKTCPKELIALIDEIRKKINLKQAICQNVMTTTKAIEGMLSWKTIDYTDITFCDNLGKGRIGSVYRVAWKGKKVAAKSIEHSDHINVKEIMLKESRLWTQLRHTNLLRFYGYYATPEITMVTECGSAGSLYKLLHVEKVKLSAREVVDIALQIALGLHYLHSFYAGMVVHQNLKSQNIILFKKDNRYIAKISDYGFTKLIKKLDKDFLSKKPVNWKNSIRKDDIPWIAPETLVKPKEKPKASQDIYSFGVILYEMLMNKVPFASVLQAQKFDDYVDKICKEERDAFAPSSHPKLVSIANTCWKGHTKKRPKTETLVTLLRNVYTELEEKERGGNELHIACAGVDNKALTASLKDISILVTAKDSNGDTPLHLACSSGCFENVEALVARNAPRDAKNNNGLTPLDIAIQAGDFTVTKHLMHYGAPLSLRTFQLAAAQGNVTVFDYLTKFQSSVNLQGPDGAALMRVAAHHGKYDLVRFLLNRGSPLHAVSDKGQTALHVAAQKGFVQIVKLLIQSKVPVDLPTDNGICPIHIAVFNQRLNVVQYLVEAGANVNRKDELGDTPILYAAQLGNLDAVKMLLGAGALIDEAVVTRAKKFSHSFIQNYIVTHFRYMAKLKLQSADSLHKWKHVYVHSIPHLQAMVKSHLGLKDDTSLEYALQGSAVFTPLEDLNELFKDAQKSPIILRLENPRVY